MGEVTENNVMSGVVAETGSAGRYERIEIPLSMAGERIDRALAELLEGISRARIQQWIGEGLVLLDDEVPRQKDRITGGESVEIFIPDSPAGDWPAEDIPLDIVYQDEAILVINKPAGLVVHPGAGNTCGTLLNGLLHHDASLRAIPRAGIVHRLDKDTTGLMVVARTETARLDLIGQLSARSVGREYLALVCGQVISGGTVDEPIARDSRDRRRMAVRPGGKEAVTHYRVAERFSSHTLLRVRLETGRTHQIRVHMRFAGFPLVGDRVYGRRLAIPRGCDAELESLLRAMQRQALHAGQLGFLHPLDHSECQWSADLPVDMLQLLEELRHNEPSYKAP